MADHRMVRKKNDPAQIGTLTGEEMTRSRRRMLQVQFPDGIKWVPEEQLEPVGERRLSPLDMLKQKKLVRPADLRRALTHEKLSGRLADVIYSMEATNTDFYAYQFKPVVKILESPSNGILIADEVGLGKTIEAGLIWTELRSRYDMHRLVVLCPAALREKWAYELSSKIGVQATICDADAALRILQDPISHERGFTIIASFQGLRPIKNWEDDSNHTGSARLARFIRSRENEDHLVDLLIMDEAHHLRNSETSTNELGRLFKRVSDYVVLLTATPIHNRSTDLYSLLQLLDPDTFTRADVFEQILKANEPLIKARDLVLGSRFNLLELKKLIVEARKQPYLHSNRQLQSIQEYLDNPDELDPREYRSRLAYRLETVNLLAHVVTRTRKKDVKEWRVIREPVPEFVSMTPVEERFYSLVTALVQEYAKRGRGNELFLLSQPQRQMASSMPAALRFWQSRRFEIEETEATGIPEVDRKDQEILGPLVGQIVSRSHKFVDLQELYKGDSKYRRFREILVRFLNENPGQKAVVFSSFRATLEYLAERLDQDGIDSIQLKGGQPESKAEIIRQFMQPEGARILLSSEVGGEGVDLQFCRVLVNYDLPWNPMRLEQRIGRIDRLGQMAEKVTIWNLFYAGTIDSRIYERLYEKLDICHMALGDFEAIIGEEIRKLEMDLLSGELSEEQQKTRIDQTAQALVNLRQEEHHLEEEAASLVAYGDYILNHVQASRELNRWISSSDLKQYVLEYLLSNYQGCSVRQMDSDPLLYELELSSEAKFDLAEYLKTQKALFSTRLASGGGAVWCRFENRITALSSRHVELISQFHPLVKMISKKIYEKEVQLTPAVSIRLDRKELKAASVLVPDSGLYLLVAEKWVFQGLQDIEKLVYAATPFAEPVQMLSQEDAERLASAAISYGRDWLEAKAQVDIERVHQICNDTLFDSLDREYERFVEELTAKNEDRADIQMHTLENHFNNELQKLKSIRDRHMEMKRDALVKATEGRILHLRERVEQKRMEIHSRRRVRCDSSEVALALIEIVE